MSSTNSPNMNLIIPTVGTQPGPTYASDINNSLTLIDQHDHTNGSGVPITPAAININSALDFDSNFATGIAGLVFSTSGSAPATNATLYQTGDDLYFVDGLGNDVRITQSGGVAGSPGSIANLASPASATYVSGTSTFVWESNTGIAANMDGGSVLLRNLSPNSTYALTLAPPSALASNYTITLPSLPASTLPVKITSAGAMSASQLVTADIGTGVVTATQLAPNAVETAKILDGAVTTDKILNSAVTAAKISSAVLWNKSQTFTSNDTFAVPAGVTNVLVGGCGGGGGGGGGAGAAGASATAGGGGGGGAAPWGWQVVAVTPSTNVTVSVAAGGSGGFGGAANTNGQTGSDGGQSAFGAQNFRGGKGGGGGRSTANGGIAGPGGGLSIGAHGGEGGGSTGSTGDPGESGWDSVAFGGGGGAASGVNIGSGGGGGGASEFGSGGSGGRGANYDSGGAPAEAGSSGSTGSGGGGGGSGYSGGGGAAGGVGGNGRVVVYWVQPS